MYPTLADVCGLPIPAGLDGVSLRPWLEDPAAPARKVAISQYPRGGEATGHRPLMGYSIRNDRWRLTAWRDRKNAEIVATELYDEQNDPAETVNLAANPKNKLVVEALSKYLPPFVADVPAKKTKSKKKAKAVTGKTVQVLATTPLLIAGTAQDGAAKFDRPAGPKQEEYS